MSDQKISISNGKLVVPDNPTIPFIEGDGTGVDIWPASQRVFDAAVEKAYKGKRKINWKEVLAGEKSFKKVNSWLPEETLATFRMRLLFIVLLLPVLQSSGPWMASDKAICLTQEEKRLYDLIMAYRKEQGLPPIPLSAKLTRVAQTHARDLATHYTFDPLQQMQSPQLVVKGQVVGLLLYE